MKKFIIFDTETTGIDNPLIYDIGWRIIDKTGYVYEQENFAIREIITNPELMRDAYYHKKIYINYIEMLASQMIKLDSFNFVMKKFNGQVKRHNAKVICAYNLGFDLRALKSTNMAINSKPFIPVSKKLQKLDIWQFACETFLNSRNYKKHASKNGWVSDKGNFKTDAENAYRYLSENHNFIEDHTALSDVIIEQHILLKALGYKRKIPYGKVNKHPWRIVNS